VEARTNDDEVGRELDRIGAAVDAGDRDLTALGFWRLVARLKRDPPAADRWADRIGRIDAAAFERGVRIRVPVAVGNLVLLLLTLLGAAFAVVARVASSEVLAGIALVAAGATWSVSTHDLAHWLVGRAVGIRFTACFLGGPFPPRPGLKTDYASYLRADASGRAAMHASGAIATKLAPFVAIAFWPGTEAPWWSAAALLLLGVGQIATDVRYSVRSSDWKRVRRERAIARELAAGANGDPTYTEAAPGSPDGPG
jgi:hypothetical protein